MDQRYEAWLRRQGYDANTINAQLYRARRVEEYYGDFDRHFEIDQLSSVIEAFVYTTEDARKGRPNPTLIPFKGAAFGNMNGYKFSVRLYRRYREATGESDCEGPGNDVCASRATEMRAQGDRKSPAKSAFAPVESPVTLAHFGIDGFAAFQALIARSHYKSLAQAIASLTLFSHPDTVRQTGGKSIFRTIRGQSTRGQYTEKNGIRVMHDDNQSASDAFKWANGLTGRLPDVQFNHIYTASQDVETYTSLANICVTPAFIAKLTDSSSPLTSALLKFRVFDLYNWTPAGIAPPNKPEGYDQLDWAPTLPAVADLKTALETRMARKPKNRTVLSTKEIGWLFADA